MQDGQMKRSQRVQRTYDSTRGWRKQVVTADSAATGRLLEKGSTTRKGEARGGSTASRWGGSEQNSEPVGRQGRPVRVIT
ncbi:hypothetical protein GCM10010422_36770 [Streptomyces graminearus]|uniref:Uncharacterized protein n=1 Tax=Streptomyces graminearus TaxID=284030 RepID=A0ABP5YXA3_9ACTN